MHKVLSEAAYLPYTAVEFAIPVYPSDKTRHHVEECIVNGKPICAMISCLPASLLNPGGFQSLRMLGFHSRPDINPTS